MPIISKHSLGSHPICESFLYFILYNNKSKLILDFSADDILFSITALIGSSANFFPSYSLSFLG